MWEREYICNGGGGGVEGLWKLNTSYSQIKPISDKKKVGPFWPKKLGRFGLGRFGFGPFCPGPFRIWAVLTIIPYHIQILMTQEYTFSNFNIYLTNDVDVSLHFYAKP